mmetsp:Transcript_54176/g.126536  ORF Transcript_54176/g.126536 Transcript_54176/m.126536 type:complete len:400 (-) Transcript_54176:218-1417(-)
MRQNSSKSMRSFPSLSYRASKSWSCSKSGWRCSLTKHCCSCITPMWSSPGSAIERKTSFRFRRWASSMDKALYGSATSSPYMVANSIRSISPSSSSSYRWRRARACWEASRPRSPSRPRHSTTSSVPSFPFPSRSRSEKVLRSDGGTLGSVPGSTKEGSPTRSEPKPPKVAVPKSTSLYSQPTPDECSTRTMLCGLMSRWMRPSSCTCDSPSSRFNPTRQASLTRNDPRSTTRSESDDPLKCSITKYTSPPFSAMAPISMRRATQGLSTLRNASPSFSSNDISPASGRHSLMATRRGKAFGSFGLASSTQPYVPLPISYRTSYLSVISCGRRSHNCVELSCPTMRFPARILSCSSCRFFAIKSIASICGCRAASSKPPITAEHFHCEVAPHFTRPAREH